MTTPEDTTKTTADITTINIADSRFNRFDDEFIDKWFNEQGKQAIQDYITLHTQKVSAELVSRTHKFYEKEMTHLKHFQEMVVREKSMSIEPIRFCAGCSAHLTNPTEAGEL